MIFDFIDKWRNYRIEITQEFYQYIDDLLVNESVMDLDNFTHHHYVTRLEHSLDVAYYSFILAKLLHWDSRSVARAGLLHDLFFYDRHDENYDGKRHAAEHPKIALENAKKICELNKVEEDIILKHMWLLTVRPPRFREGYIVTFVDKYCATREALYLFSRSRLRAVHDNA